MFDTHCHLNFSAFKKNLDEVINNAKSAGVDQIVIPGTDYESSKKAVEIAEKYEGIYVAVGIHPHHIYQYFKDSATQFLSHESLTSPPKAGGPLESEKITFTSSYQTELKDIKRLLTHPKVVAIGEIGIDRHIYQKTKYNEYRVDEEFIQLQKAFLKAQIKLAIEYKKSIILHNRGAKEDLLKIISEPAVAKALAGKVVFHCCEPDDELLDFAKEHNIFIGVDGDVTYDRKKQEFVKKVPLELLVLETDSPYLLPEPLRNQNFLRLRQGFGRQSNEPKNLQIIAEFIADLRNISINQLIDTSTENAKRLFQLAEYKRHNN